MHFLSRNIFHGWYTREERFERVNYVPLDKKSELRIFKLPEDAMDED